MKFAIKAIWQYPPYLRHVATLPSKFHTLSSSANILKID